MVDLLPLQCDGDARRRGSYTFASLASTSRFVGALLVLGNCTAIVSSNLSHFKPNSFDSLGLTSTCCFA